MRCSSASPEARRVRAGAVAHGELARVLLVFSRGATRPEACGGGAAAVVFAAAGQTGAARGRVLGRGDAHRRGEGLLCIHVEAEGKDGVISGCGHGRRGRATSRWRQLGPARQGQ